MKPTTMAAALCVIVGCVKTQMPNAIEHKQFAFIAAAVVEHVRNRPPVTEEEAKRLTDIHNVATQGLALTKIELKLVGQPEGTVPEATDHLAVHHETKVFERDVEMHLALRALVDPFLPKSGGLPTADIIGGGGLLSMATALFGLLRSRKKLKRCIDEKDLALGQMFKVAGDNVEKQKLAEALEGTEAQVEYRHQRGEPSAKRS